MSEQPISNALIPCAHCAKNLHASVLPIRGSFEVVCDATLGGCGASGGAAPTIEKAIEKWNRRVETADVATLRQDVARYENGRVILTQMVEDLKRELHTVRTVAELQTERDELKAVLDDLEDSFDQAIYPEQAKEDFDAPDAREYSVTITAKQWRAMGRAIGNTERAAKRRQNDPPAGQALEQPDVRRDNYGRAQPPDGYAYRYHAYGGDVIRFNSGEEVNGGKPFEAVPYWLGTTPSAPPPCAECERLRSLINTPHTHDFIEAVKLEMPHQRERWGSEHDAGKTPADWFWLVGYLAGKALHSFVAGNIEKAKHHLITTAAALGNWFLAITGESASMRPGIASPPEARE